MFFDISCEIKINNDIDFIRFLRKSEKEQMKIAKDLIDFITANFPMRNTYYVLNSNVIIFSDRHAKCSQVKTIKKGNRQIVMVCGLGEDYCNGVTSFCFANDMDTDSQKYQENAKKISNGLIDEDYDEDGVVEWLDDTYTIPKNDVDNMNNVDFFKMMIDDHVFNEGSYCEFFELSNQLCDICM